MTRLGQGERLTSCSSTDYENSLLGVLFVSHLEGVSELLVTDEIEGQERLDAASYRIVHIDRR